MRSIRSRFGKIAIKLVVAGSTAAAGGLYTASTMMKDGEKSASAPTVAALKDSGSSPESLVSESSRIDSPSAIRQAEPAPSRPAPMATASNFGGESAVSAPKKKQAEQPDAIRVFYATDRYLCSAKDVHLWITTLVPAMLVVAVTAIMLIGACIAPKRRVVWGLGAASGCLLSFVVVGNTIIKANTLYRLASDNGLWFTSQRNRQTEAYPLNLGTTLVSLPPEHLKGQIERPSILRLEFQEREDRHVMIQRIEALDTDEFYSQLDERVGEDEERSAFVFIHGYNVTFDDALRRTAQLSFDLEFPGAPILYSWPSHGSLAWYRSDGENAVWSADHLQRFLIDVRNRTGVKRLHVVAHSMGNRTLVAGLELLGLRFPNQQPMLDQVIMAAPDVDLEDFQTRYADDVDLCAQRATVYASSSDKALIASLHLNKRQRLGLTMASRATVAGVDFVDVTPIDTSLLGHSYYGSHPLMIQELAALFSKDLGPERRSWLTQKDKQIAPPVWKFAGSLSTVQ